MTRAEKAAFAGLVLAQAAHSIEEYRGRLWEVLAPAEFLSGTVSSNPETGFIILNIGVVAAILFTFLVFVLPSRTAAPAIAWFWIIVEIINGAGHLSWAALRGGYAPGAMTAPALLLFAPILLAMRFRHRRMDATAQRRT